MARRKSGFRSSTRASGPSAGDRSAGERGGPHEGVAAYAVATSSDGLVPVVPPRGALPRRFGAGPFGVFLLRLAAVGAAVTLVASLAAVTILKDFAPESVQTVAKGVVLPLSAYLAALLFRRGKVAPVAIAFEPAGVTIVRMLGSDRFAWGELVGLAPPDPGSTAWFLVARRGTREWRTRLEGGRGWTKDLVDELRGKAIESPPGAGGGPSH